MGEPSALRDSRRTNTARCSRRGMIFSMPIEAMCSVGTLADRSALPSLVQTTNAARLGDREIAPVMPGVGRKDEGRVACALRLGQVVHVAVVGIGADGRGKHLRNVGSQLVHGRHHDMARVFVVELLDALAQIGLNHLERQPRPGTGGSHTPR